MGLAAGEFKGVTIISYNMTKCEWNHRKETMGEA